MRSRCPALGIPKHQRKTKMKVKQMQAVLHWNGKQPTPCSMGNSDFGIFFLRKERQTLPPYSCQNPTGLLGLSSRMGGTEDQNQAQIAQNYSQLSSMPNTSSLELFSPLSHPFTDMYTYHWCFSSRSLPKINAVISEAQVWGPGFPEQYHHHKVCLWSEISTRTWGTCMKKYFCAADFRKN